MEVRRGGYRYCPFCGQKVETRVQGKGYGQVPYRDVLAKRRKVMCWKTINGDPGCGHTWFTYEIPEEVLPEIVDNTQTGSGRNREKS
jgi:hypothetical protein